MEGQKEQLSKLIDRYEALTTAERKKYNEANTRRNFILPLFEILGWDVRSEDVSEEVQTSGKRVDYAFKINDITRFFIEAKSLDADLDEIRWSEQAIWYAYHKSVPWVVLTNFEEIKVFNAEWDSPEPETSLFFELKYNEYLKNFEKLSLLSRESVESGELDEKALEWGKKPKTVSTVGERLTEDLLNWRDNLFNDLVGYNPILKKEIAADSVQKFINRLIFIRTCEDRGLEQKRLQEVLRAWEDGGNKNNDLMKRIQALFSEFNDNYDSKLFEDEIIFDADSNKLIFEESVIAKVIEETYKNSRGIRWNFNDINADVLGSVYEQYLGQIQSGKANEEEKKSSKRKSQGIYYTPRYIVDYIVKNTLGEALKGKTFNEILKLKVLDPACGSGSFLIRAFEEALVCLRKETGKINRDFDDYALRWSVLTSMIYGVDLDQEAVEITQLNLLLKTLGRREKLPNLSNKIDCGNSLISGNEEELKKYFGKDWKDKKPFNWEERFSEVFKQGGFDVIIGNPPYVGYKGHKEIFENINKTNFGKKYHNKEMDIWYYFVHKGLDLLKEGGVLSFITTKYWFTADGAEKLREDIKKRCEIVQIIDFGEQVIFKGAKGQHNCIFVLKKKKPEHDYEINWIKLGDPEFDLKVAMNDKAIVEGNTINIKNLDLFDVKSGQVILLEGNNNLINKIEEKTVPLSYFCDVFSGIKTGADKVFVLGKQTESGLVLDDSEKEKYLKKFYKNSNIQRYFTTKSSKDLLLVKNGEDLKNRKIYKYLNKYKDVLYSRKARFGVMRNRLDLNQEDSFLARFNKPFAKIIVPYRSKILCFALTYDEFFSAEDIYYIQIKKEFSKEINEKFLLALLNSQIVKYWYLIKGKKKGNIFEFTSSPLKRIPIIKIQPEKQETVINLVNKIISLIKNLQELDPILDEDEYKEIKAEIDKTDKEIDEKVYKLYGLTPEEIKIVEGGAK